MTSGTIVNVSYVAYQSLALLAIRITYCWKQSTGHMTIRHNNSIALDTIPDGNASLF